MAGPDLSAIVLGYRAGASLDPLARRLHESLAASGHSFEIVLVANYHDGADDDTPGVAERLTQDLSVTRVVAHPKEGGMGWDLRSGLDAALGDVLVVIDGDGQYATGDVIVAFERLRETGSDIAKGRRASRGDGLYRRVVTTGFNLAFAILFPRRGVSDVNGKPKAIARSAYERLRLTSDDWFLDAELVLEAHRLGMKVCEFPVVYSEGARASFVKPGAILEFARHMLRYRFTGRP
jgi:glycosyltransferase involved in cell wall biosynthesis